MGNNSSCIPSSLPKRAFVFLVEEITNASNYFSCIKLPFVFSSFIFPSFSKIIYEMSNSFPRIVYLSGIVFK
jgi:hypothetical protein